ncbi:MAG: MATE family efflux transporter [Spirochaetales bacterium]|nr:MATE family efflux transporter [Spirochaetales bacterium]
MKRIFSNKDLWLLIWPLLVEQLLQITLGIADIFMVSSVGKAAVSGVSLVDQINILLTQIFAALGTGGAVVCAQYIGAGNEKMAEESAKHIIIIVFSIALFFLFTGLIFYRQILEMIFGGVEADVMKSSERYFFITLFALPGIALYSAAASLFRVQGNSRISMITALLVNVLNIGGNFILIYKMHCGVEGVAIPTFISRTSAAIVLLYFLYKGKSFKGKKSISIKGISKIDFQWHLTGKILKIGIPNGIENSTFQIGKIIVMSLVATYGTNAVAANAAANTLCSLEVFPAASVGLGMLTVVGQCMGAGEIEQAGYYTKKLMAIAFASMMILNIPFLFMAHKAMELFNMEHEVTEIGYIITFCHGFFALFIWPLSFTLPNALRAAGDATFTMIVSMISMWTVRVGLAYLFKYTGTFGLMEKMHWSLSYGVISVWLAMFIDWAVRSTFFIARFARGKWKLNRLI